MRGRLARHLPLALYSRMKALVLVPASERMARVVPVPAGSR